jgi:hypothetical protein
VLTHQCGESMNQADESAVGGPVRSEFADGPLQYFLGTHRPNWLASTSRPLFVSHRSLRSYKRLPRARGAWALDSGGFTELSLSGGWRTSPREYATAVRRYRDEVGLLEFASQQDWMCEPLMRKKTGLSVLQHQERTIDNYCALMALDPDVPWLPVVQGWCRYEYEQHVEMWTARGVDLARVARVGVGSICRRTNVVSIGAIVSTLARDYGLRVHAFGLKVGGLNVAGGWLASADSMAWSYAARREKRARGALVPCSAAPSPNHVETALDWFEERIRPILEQGFCAETGFSLRYLPRIEERSGNLAA